MMQACPYLSSISLMWFIIYFHFLVELLLIDYMADIIILFVPELCYALFYSIAVTFLWSLNCYIDFVTWSYFYAITAVPFPLWIYWFFLLDSAGLCYIIFTLVKALSGSFLVVPVSVIVVISWLAITYLYAMVLWRFLNSWGAPLMFINAHLI